MSVIINGTSGISTDGGSELFGSGSIGGSLTLTSGTANGVTYLNGSKVLTSGSALTFDGSNLGLGVTPSAWNADYKVEQIGSTSSFYGRVASAQTGIGENFYRDAGGTFRYITSNQVSRLELDSGAFYWYTAGSGTAGNAISFTQAMTLDASGNLLVGTTAKLNYNAGGTYKNLSIDGGTGTDNRAEISLAGGGGGANYNLGRINFGLSSNTTNAAAGINGYSSAAGASTGGVLAFSTASDISVGPYSERMRIDSAGNLGLGVTPSAFATVKAMQLNTASTLMAFTNEFDIGQNVYYNAGNKYITTGAATLYAQITGQHQWFNAPSGTAGNAISFTQAMTLTAAGDLGVGTSSITSGFKLDVLGDARFSDVAGDDGVELGWSAGGSAGFVQAYDRGASAFRDLILNNAVTISSSGSVGIGTSSPTTILDVSQTTSGTNNALDVLRLNHISSGTPTSGLGAGILFSSTRPASSINLTRAAIYGVAGTDPNDDGDLVFFTRTDTSGGGFSQKMCITSAGNVGIGTSSPSVRLHVDGDIWMDAAGATRLKITHAGGGEAQIDNPTAALRFATGSTERARIDSSGKLLVGTTSSYGSWLTQINQSSGNALILAGTAGDILMVRSSQASSPSQSIASFFSDNVGGTNYSSGTLRFNFLTNGGLQNYQANDSNLSDRREKTNFAPAGEYLSKICAIPVQTFNYIDQNLETDDGLTLGVVAQDVQAVAPELVSESNWGTEENPKMRLSIYQTDLQYALMKCIQEQQAIIEQLQADVATLKGTA